MPGPRILLAATVACAVLLTACGSSSPGAGATGTTAAANRDPALKFATCMRSHGVTNFPDPGPGGGIEIGPNSGIDARSPAFQAAQKACARYAPIKGGPTPMTASQRRQALAFARCVRAHGVPNFPDPSETRPSGAHFVIALRGMVFAFTSAFDPRSPAFQHAASACGVRPPGS
jgi:hypothetical protein